MRLFATAGLLGLLAMGSFARAQVTVAVQTQRTDFLLYERVDLLVTITNAGENDLVLDNSEGHPWLSFLVSKKDRLPVRQERQGLFKALALKVGESKILRVNLTPLFSFREEGQYRAAAVVDLPGEGQIVSDSAPFAVDKGRTVWSQTRPAGGSQRVYSLIRFSPQPDITKLYLRVEDPSENVVYTNLALGEIVAYIDPEVFFDPAGNIHILQPIGSESHLYTRADPSGKILHQGIFRAYLQVPPRLVKMEDGNVTVLGGLEMDPSRPRERLSDTQKTADARTPAAGPAPDTMASPGPAAPPDIAPVLPPPVPDTAPAPAAAPATSSMPDPGTIASPNATP